MKGKCVKCKEPATAAITVRDGNPPKGWSDWDPKVRDDTAVRVFALCARHQGELNVFLTTKG
jgi:hypothetical protein